MKYKLAKLNSKGLDIFKSFLVSCKKTPDIELPLHMLDKTEYCEIIQPEIIVDNEQPFKTRLEFGKYLNQILSSIEDEPGLPMDQGVWSWLCLAFFDLFCPPDKNSNRKVKKDWYYILSRDYKHHYRHLVRTPWYIYKFHGQNSAVVLSVPLTVAGEAVEQLLSRQQIATNQSLFDAMYTLYIEKETEPPEIKRGARGIGGGSMRRMGKILKQFDLTYDLRAMTGIQIYELLPREFNRYKPT